MIKLVDILKEVDYSLHRSDRDDISWEDLEPYGGGTDGLFRMSGRGTGHFGSGTYLSTYKYEGSSISIENFRDKIDSAKGKPIIKVANGIYAIDLDSYNLYKPKGINHARLLFNTLKKINELFYFYVALNRDGEVIEAEDRARFKKDLQSIKDDVKQLGLDFDREFIKSVVRIVKPYISRSNYPKDRSLFASISTKFMEHNGYNGVNVNDIGGYNGMGGFDNTIHGSVIYDINKRVSTKKETPRMNTPNFWEDNWETILKNANEKIYSVDMSKWSLPTLNKFMNSYEKIIDFGNLNYMKQWDKLTQKQYDHIEKNYSRIFKRKIKNIDWDWHRPKIPVETALHYIYKGVYIPGKEALEFFYMLIKDYMYDDWQWFNKSYIQKVEAEGNLTEDELEYLENLKIHLNL